MRQKCLIFVTHSPIIPRNLPIGGIFFYEKMPKPCPEGAQGVFFSGPEGAVRKAGGPKGHVGMMPACLPALPAHRPCGPKGSCGRPAGGQAARRAGAKKKEERKSAAKRKKKEERESACPTKGLLLRSALRASLINLLIPRRVCCTPCLRQGL